MSQTPSIPLLAGPQILGGFANWGLQGALTVQTYFYCMTFPNDPLANKLLVYGVLIWEWVQTGLVTDIAFSVYVYGFGKPEELVKFHNGWFSIMVMAPVVSAVVQIFFALRIFRLSRSKIVFALISFFAIAQMSVGITGGIMLHVLSPAADAYSNVTPVIASWLAGAAFVDVLIAGTMTYFLLKAKGGNHYSDGVLNRLIMLVIETGSFTAVCAIADTICFTAASDTLLHEFFAVTLAKVYANTLLVSLNNRAYLRTPSANSSYNLHAVGDRQPPLVGRINIQTDTLVTNGGDGLIDIGKHFSEPGAAIDSVHTKRSDV